MQRPIRRSAGSSFRLSDSAVTDRIAQYEEQRREHRDPVVLESLMQAWVAFRNGHPDKHILTSAMRNCSLQQVGPEAFVAKVGQPMEVQAFESEKKELMDFLRQTLRNDYLTLAVEIDPTRNAIKQLPPQEFLKECVEKNPALASLLTALDAELA